MAVNRNLPLSVAGIIFGIVSLFHLLRLICRTEIIVGGYIVPMSASYIGFFIALVLAIWMFKARRDTSGP
jgi:hypothetical protein